ncbi:MAG: rod shape-determining protein MreC [Bacteroidales bacterium]|nr:rod shape-determining protein MreC [Bacteroidales bacterium]
MRNSNSWIPRLIAIAIFILLEIASLNMLRRNAPLQRMWVARAAHGFMGSIWGGSQRVGDYFALRRINAELAEENAELRRQNSQLEDIVHQAKVDTMRYGITRVKGFTYVPCEIRKISRNKQHNYMILDKGLEDGIQENSGVITRNGVVGIVEAVSEHYCYALSLQNTDISVSARIGEEGATGLLSWDGYSSNGASLREIPLQYKFEKGDTVYTSGHSLVFPPDIPLGVAGDSHVVNGQVNEIKVTLFQDFTALRYVTVAFNNAKKEVEGLAK